MNWRLSAGWPTSSATNSTQIGANVRDINSRLDALSRDVADLRDQFNRMVKFSGDFFVGVRSDRSRVPFFDYSGAARRVQCRSFQNVNAVHDFHLDARANLAGGVKFTGDLVASNYLGYRAAGTNYFTGGVAEALGGPSATAPAQFSPAEEVTPVPGALGHSDRRLRQQHRAHGRSLQEPGHPAHLLPSGHGCLLRHSLVR